MIISRFAGVPALGEYIIGCKLPELAKFITHQPISQVSMPALAKLHNDHPKIRKAIYEGTELNAVISFAVFVGIAAVASDLVPLLLGSKWSSAANLCSLLSIYTLINVLQVFNHPTLVTAGANRDYVLLNIGQVVGVISACLIGVQFGTAYVALGLIINALIVTIPALLLLRKWVGLEPREFIKRCLSPALASIIMAVMIYGINYLLPGGIPIAIRLSIKVLVGAIVYLGVLWLTGPAALKKIYSLSLNVLNRNTRNPSPITDSPIDVD